MHAYICGRRQQEGERVKGCPTHAKPTTRTYAYKYSSTHINIGQRELFQEKERKRERENQQGKNLYGDGTLNIYSEASYQAMSPRPYCSP